MSWYPSDGVVYQNFGNPKKGQCNSAKVHSFMDETVKFMQETSWVTQYCFFGELIGGGESPCNSMWRPHLIPLPLLSPYQAFSGISTMVSSSRTLFGDGRSLSSLKCGAPYFYQ